LYEKIFWSNNLPSITPANKKYHSIFIAKERNLLRRIFIGAIKNLTVVAS
jgi:hypothetical protein